VDPETGETAPLSPQPLIPMIEKALADGAVAERFSVTQAYDRSRSIALDQFLDAATLGSVPEATRRAWLYGEWDDYESDLAAHLEPDDAA
jgi:hypothetical protein